MSNISLESIFSVKQIIFNTDETNENNIIDQAVEILQKDGIVYIIEDIDIHKWYYFCKEIEKRSISGTVILETPLPTGWRKPNTINIRLFRYIVWRAYKTLMAIDRVPNQNLKTVSKDFFALYGHFDWHREVLVQSLERMGVLNNSIYSRPHHDRWLPWPESYLDTDRAVTKDSKTIDSEGPTVKRFQHSKNKIHHIMETAHLCHCFLVIENDVFRPYKTPAITEKFMYPIVMGMPWIWLGDQEKYQTIKNWGFKAVEEPRSTIKDMVEQCLWYQRLFCDQEAVDRWRITQQPVIEQNFMALKNLPHILEKEWNDSKKIGKTN